MRVVCIIMLALLVRVCRGQQQLYFSIHISGEKRIGDSLNVLLKPDYVYEFGYEGAILKRIYIGSNNTYTFTLPAIEHLARLHVYGLGNDVNELLFGQLVEPGDSIHMSVVLDKYSDNVTATYSGRGAAKYAFFQTLDKGFKNPNSNFDELNSLPKTDFTAWMKKANEMNARFQQQLVQFPHPINPLVKKVLALDIAGAIENWVLRNMAWAALTQQDKNVFLKEWLPLINKKDTADPVYAYFSKEYISLLYDREKYKLAYEYDKALPNTRERWPFTFEDLYAAIKNNYQGKTREHLVTYTLAGMQEIVGGFRGVHPKMYTDCLKDGLQQVQNPVYKAMISDRLNAMGQGAPAYNFAFTDTGGKIVRLTDLKGKVVMLDIWSNPCGGCKQFNRDMKRVVYPAIKNNPDMVVVSINANRQRERWLSGLADYSEPGYTNVWVGDQGLNHPIMDHYKVTGVPTIVLVDRNGKLISATTPWTKIEELLQLIKDALAQP